MLSKVGHCWDTVCFWIIPSHLTKWVERNKRKSGDLGSDALSGVALSFVCHSLKPLALRLRPTMGHDGSRNSQVVGAGIFMARAFPWCHLVSLVTWMT